MSHLRWTLLFSYRGVCLVQIKSIFRGFLRFIVLRFYLIIFLALTSRYVGCCLSICILRFAVFFFEQAINVFLGHKRHIKCILRAELGKALLLNLKKRCERNSYFAANSSCSAVKSFASSGSAMVESGDSQSTLKWM